MYKIVIYGIKLEDIQPILEEQDVYKRQAAYDELKSIFNICCSTWVSRRKNM